MYAAIKAIEYHLPQRVETNADLTRQFPDWSIQKIAEKTGIDQRHLAAPDECASDLAFAAASKLFASGACRAEEIDFVLLCTQSPDHFLPTSACLLQHRLGIPTTAGALDFNLGCSGFIYGLSLAKGLIETGQARRLLLLTAETYSKYIDASDRSVRTIFGDGAAATLVEGTNELAIGPFVFGTDGSGAENLIVRDGAARSPGTERPRLYMDGPEIFVFTTQSIPGAVAQLLRKSEKQIGDIDLFVFHQANAYMLEHLRKKCGIPADRFVVSMRDCGNTVSATIPIALNRAAAEGRLRAGQLVMLVGFGVGYSWGCTLARWQ